MFDKLKEYWESLSEFDQGAAAFGAILVLTMGAIFLHWALVV